MGRWTQYDGDDYRLPEGMRRVGYDADDQTYTFVDSDGSYWESAPGQEYGRLRRVRGASPLPEVQISRERSGSPPPPPYTPCRRERRKSQPRVHSSNSSPDRDSSPSSRFRKSFGYNFDAFPKSGKVAKVSPTDKPDFSDFLPEEKQRGGDGRNRAVSSPMGLLRRAATVVSKAAMSVSSSDRPDKGGTRIHALEKAKVMKQEKDDAERSDSETPFKRSLSRRGTMRSRKYIEHGPGGEAHVKFGRRKTVKW